MTKIIFLLSVIMILLTNIYGGDRINKNHFTTRSEIITQRGMAATSQPLATQIALDVLKQGGTAVDAAIAANAALGLMEPPSCGIGGDLFAIVWEAKTQKLYGLNASGRSPYSLTLDYFKTQGHQTIPLRGPLPVSVPGCVDGWFELHQRFGKLPLNTILAPTIQYAREGFPVSEVIAYEWQGCVSTLQNYPNFMEYFTFNGTAPRKGEIFKNPLLANTLEKIAEGGRDFFYKGEIAETIDRYMKKVGGFLSYQDFFDHKSEWVEPVFTNYRGYDVWELPPNGQGIAVLQMLNILEGYDLQSLGFGSPEYLHLFIEAKKLAFEDRAKFYADPDFNRIPVKELISKKYGDSRRQIINLNRASKSLEAGNPFEMGDTIYLTVADQERNMVSLIQSNFLGMGSGMAPDDLGFVLQNRGALFTLEEGRFNTYESHKRPFHTIIPAFLTQNGRPLMSFGVMGGDMQPQGHVQILVNIIDFGMNLQEAGDAPRVRHGGSSQPTGEKMNDGGTVYLESGFPDETINRLKKLGHQIKETSGGFGGYQAIWFEEKNNVFIGASESRKDGQAAGY
jgi:gamma-glutamyltranspeptidase/glutathione hydrolase